MANTAKTGISKMRIMVTMLAGLMSGDVGGLWFQFRKCARFETSRDLGLRMPR